MNRFLVCLLLIFTCGSTTAEGLLPIDDFIRHGDYLDVKISPDGGHIAATIRQDDTVFLAFVRLSDNAIVGGTKPGSGREVYDVTWVNNERVFYRVAQKRFFLDRPVGSNELYATNVDNSKRANLYGYRAGGGSASRLKPKEDSLATMSVLSTLPGDEKYILIIEHPWSSRGNSWYDGRRIKPIVSKMNVYTGRKKKIEELPYPNCYPIADASGNIRFITWRDKQNNYYSAYREMADDEWRQLDTVFDVAQDWRPVGINAAATKIYLRGLTARESLKTVFELDLASGELEQLFYGLDADVMDWIEDFDTDAPVVGISFPDKGRYHYAPGDSATADYHRVLADAFEGQDVTFSSETLDGKQVLVRVRSDRNPGEYYIFDTETSKAEFLMPNRSWIDPRQMRSVRSATIETRDGEKIHAYLTLPDGADALTPAPLVVLIHGGPHGVRDFWAFDSEVQLLASRGFAVLQVNFRGSGGYGERYERMGYRQWGGRMIEDILDATEWAAAQDAIDRQRMCTYGASYGGYAALMAVVRAPDIFKCTIGYVGVYDLTLMYEKGDIPRGWGGVAYLQKVIGRDPEQLEEYSPISHVDEIKAQVMLIHGEQDIRVPVKHARVMRSALEKTGKQVDWLMYNRSGHGVWAIESRWDLYTNVLRFLNEHIGESAVVAGE